MSLLRYMSLFSIPYSKSHPFSISTPLPSSIFQSLPPLPKFKPKPTPSSSSSSSDFGNFNNNNNNNNNNNSNNNNNNDNESSGASESAGGLPVIGALIAGWHVRVAADPKFPFKVVMEELVGVSACVAGDMASRPNFGLNELDFVFSTVVVGSILNFLLMYLLAPTSTSASAAISHMFQPGPFSPADRIAVLLRKGALFALVGFAAGLVGTAISTALINLRKKIDPRFEPPNKPPPTLLNAATWAGHMGVSSNLRYQTLNGVEFLMEKSLPGIGFKVSVFVLRCLNNVLGGVTFVALARFTGSQKPPLVPAAAGEDAAEGERKSE